MLGSVLCIAAKIINPCLSRKYFQTSTAICFRMQKFLWWGGGRESHAFTMRTLQVLIFCFANLKWYINLELDNPDLDSSFFKIFVLYFFASYLDLEAFLPLCLIFSCMKEDDNIYIHPWVELMKRKEVISVIEILIICYFVNWLGRDGTLPFIQ